MGRNKKFSDAELRQITEEAIDEITRGGRYLVDINRMKVFQAISPKYPLLQYSDTARDAVKKVIKEYEKKVKDVMGVSTSDLKSPVMTERIIEPRKLMIQYKNNPEAFEAELVQFADRYNRNIRLIYDLSNENSRLWNEASESGNGKSILQSENEDLKKRLEAYIAKYNNAKQELEKYKTEFMELEELAGLIVVQDCYTDKIDLGESEERILLSEQLTYRQSKDKKRENEHKEKILKLLTEED